MKLKPLLLFIAIASVSVLRAQEPYRGLVITEASMTSYIVYFEITNMGDSAVDLREIKFGQAWPQSITAVYDPWKDPWSASDRYFYLPESVAKVLQPGESFTVTLARDFGLNMYNARIAGYGGNNRQANHDIYQYADFLIHYAEKNADELLKYPQIKDSVLRDSIYTYNAQHTLSYLNLPQCGLYIEHHFSKGDSAAIDQVGNMLDNNGKNSSALYDVAGVYNAGTTALLVRKPVIKQGNLDFANARGVGLDDSEWMALAYPNGLDNWRDIWWTIGNHGNYMLDAKTLESNSDAIKVDFAGKTITVPWGTTRLDEIMRNMKKKPGIAWIYHLNESFEDSLLRTAQTGDKLSIYVFGSTLYTETFNIIVKEPTSDANMVVPIDHVDPENQLTGGPISENVQHGILNWPRVTNHKNGKDTITGSGYGLPNALRTDSLLKYLEKPANAKWEFVFVDGNKRADLKNGDKLKVIAQNGGVKEYFIEVQSYNPNHNANLSSITWPDIPEIYRGLYGWKGDTIPNFNPYGYNYKVTVPIDVEGIPALVAKTENLNASIVVNRATTFSGTTADRTITFTVTAEDDSVINTYTIELVKEKDPTNIQPYFADPFISEAMLGVIEIYNPGNQPLDLSNYMISSARFGGTVPGAITSAMAPSDWNGRYRKYVPGYKWLPQLEWVITPGILQSDINVYPIVLPGEVFTLGYISGDPFLMDILDVQFNNSTTIPEIKNPWNEVVTGINAVPWAPVHNTFLFKILNDSIKLGLKPANNPNDFELIDILGNGDGSRDWKVAGGLPWDRLIRKPNVYKGNPILGASFGKTPENSEWIPQRYGYKYGNTGSHFMNEITIYMSTVNSKAYKVSPGYSWNESIMGIVTDTKVSDFMANLYKADKGQTLKVKSRANGSELAMNALLSLNDTLIVLSADSINTTKYILNVDETGLSSNAVLTSKRYTITIDKEPKSASNANTEAGIGKVTGFDYGTTLRTILANITVPPGAMLTVVDKNGAYVPLKQLNFDTAYVYITVNNSIYLDVVAENGVTKIIYQLVPQVSENDAFVTSDVYAVVQRELLIQYVPGGTNVQSLFSNLIASVGAKMKLVDKLGNERTVGYIVQDDKVVVTSPNGLNSKVYYIAMLPTQYAPETTYLAYIQSAVYSVDQVVYKVDGVDGSETVSNFLTKITPSDGASVAVVDKNGTVKINGDINGGDRVMVTSADGKMKVYYSFGPLTGVKVYESNGIDLYPNPTNGKINVSGVKAGNRIQVYNSFGAIIHEFKVQSSIETISFDNQPAGMYMIVISDQNKILGSYKALRR